MVGRRGERAGRSRERGGGGSGFSAKRLASG